MRVRCPIQDFRIEVNYIRKKSENGPLMPPNVRSTCQILRRKARRYRSRRRSSLGSRRASATGSLPGSPQAMTSAAERAKSRAMPHDFESAYSSSPSASVSKPAKHGFSRPASRAAATASQNQIRTRMTRAEPASGDGMRSPHERATARESARHTVRKQIVAQISRNLRLIREVLSPPRWHTQQARKGPGFL